MGNDIEESLNLVFCDLAVNRLVDPLENFVASQGGLLIDVPLVLLFKLRFISSQDV